MSTPAITTARRAKQILIVRKDLKMGRGKEIAQACHASMGVFTSKATIEDGKLIIPIPEVAEFWLNQSFTKICLQVDSEEALLELQAKAEAAGILNYLITDNGVTVFKGVPTRTVLAIGPGWSTEIDPITAGLKPY